MPADPLEDPGAFTARAQGQEFVGFILESATDLASFGISISGMERFQPPVGSVVAGSFLLQSA